MPNQHFRNKVASARHLKFKLYVPSTWKIKLEITWYVSSKCLTGIMAIIIIIPIIIIFIIIIIIITYVWVMCTREQEPQSNLSNNKGRSKKL